MVDQLTPALKVARRRDAAAEINQTGSCLDDGGLGISTHSTSENKTSDDELNRECGYACRKVSNFEEKTL